MGEEEQIYRVEGQSCRGLAREKEQEGVASGRHIGTYKPEVKTCAGNERKSEHVEGNER